MKYVLRNHDDVIELIKNKIIMMAKKLDKNLTKMRCNQRSLKKKNTHSNYWKMSFNINIVMLTIRYKANYENHYVAIDANYNNDV